ncbi:permease [Halomarina oriensis]|uniref:Permease n=1 Tax=Halomarina oriensis TaxID=671145 RepID=A0A6B0GLM4_9EURY|nr:permease [Halomarina oriensis]MWG33025.1 permease [Halomarina oriensis]
MPVLDSLVDALSLTAEMTWDTWWALVLGFTVSGAVHAFVSEERMSATLGDDGWREVGLASLFGAASSSCSYSAVATAKTVFSKGASLVATLAYTFAATDLVVELGLVMWVLLGWQFVVGEFVGGLVAVCVVTVLIRRVPDRRVEDAREHVRETREATCPTCGMSVDASEATDETTLETPGGTEFFCCGGCLGSYAASTENPRGGLTTLAGWTRAASSTVGDWEMLWRDIALGFVLAGLVGGFVPTEWWTALFGGHAGFEGVVYTTALAVVLGALSFMCSVGNVPFALVLWQNGLPFGAVLSFVYADLLIPPLVRIYRRSYGTLMGVVVVLTLALAAVTAGVVVHYVASFAGIVPQAGTGGTVDHEYTFVLNAVLTPVFLVQLVLVYGVDGVRDGLESRYTRGRDAVVITHDTVRTIRSTRSLAPVTTVVSRRLRGVADRLRGGS